MRNGRRAGFLWNSPPATTSLPAGCKARFCGERGVRAQDVPQPPSKAIFAKKNPSTFGFRASTIHAAEVTKAVLLLTSARA